MKFYVLRLVDWLPNAVRQTNQPKHIKPFLLRITYTVHFFNCCLKLIPPVNFCSDENIQTIFGTKLEDFLNYRIDYNSIS
jgi:hypothetical protein